MNLVIRTDASVDIGTGHVMRCLTLADELRCRGANISFVCRSSRDNIIDFIEKRGYKVHRLTDNEAPSTEITKHVLHSKWLGVRWETDAAQTKTVLTTEEREIDWLIIDHYALDSAWELQIRPFVKRIMVIDDLADRSHDCDVLLDQNFYDNLHTRYEGLVPEHCQKLLGPKYALLHPIFRSVRQNLRKRYGTIKSILIFFGGIDPTNETAKAIESICLLNRPDICVHVIVGESYPHREMITQMCSAIPNVVCHCRPDDIAQLMANADIALGAGGATTWERCCLGLPTLIISVSHNQKAIAEGCHQKNIGIYLGESDNVSPCQIKSEIEKMLTEKQTLLTIGENAMNMVDGLGVWLVGDTLLKHKECS